MCGFTDACPVNSHRSGTYCKFAQMRSTGDREKDRKLLEDRIAAEREAEARRKREIQRRELAAAQERRRRIEELDRQARQRAEHEAKLKEMTALRLDDRGSKIATSVAAVLWIAILLALFIS